VAKRNATVLEEQQQDDSDALFLMANLDFERTGLPFVVWISVRGDALHDVRIKVSRSPKALPSEMVSVAIRPNVHVIEGTMSASDLSVLREWAQLNQDVLVKYWNGDIESTEEAIKSIQPIKTR
jgi:hypothetical protein